jgi:hypothetical protein
MAIYKQDCLVQVGLRYTYIGQFVGQYICPKVEQHRYMKLIITRMYSQQRNYIRDQKYITTRANSGVDGRMLVWQVTCLTISLRY